MKSSCTYQFIQSIFNFPFANFLSIFVRERTGGRIVAICVWWENDERRYIAFFLSFFLSFYPKLLLELVLFCWPIRNDLYMYLRYVYVHVRIYVKYLYMYVGICVMYMYVFTQICVCVYVKYMYMYALLCMYVFMLHICMYLR